MQPKETTPEALAAATKRNRGILASSVGAWLPSYRITRAGTKPGKKRSLVQCRHVRRPPAFSGLGLLTVLTIDLAKGLEPVDSVAVMTDGRIVYASPESLYVATERWLDRPDPDKPTEEKGGVTTAIHKFDISSPVRTHYRGSGRVSGYLLSQWSLSEHRGVFRVVSTESPAWWGSSGGGNVGETESFLTTLRARAGALVHAGRIGGLGRGERVYAVRFVGDVGYVVTFRQIDPLYTVDLAVPERPRVLGELKIPGYSAYLHPVGDDLLLGVGQDVSDEGRPLGTQLSLFDVSDLRRPTRLHKASLGLGWSEAESDHHAFLFWPRTGLVVLPFEQRAVGFRVSRARGIDAAGKIEHERGKLGWTPGVRRSLVVRDSVLTVSDSGVKSSSLATLAERGWAAFPPAQPKP
ncbi:MAG: beta-propeller domain-containing protein [Actinobacteria bacterium]|nr:beta-propeller domain-containing protein [Actinomycetota bacterium]